MILQEKIPASCAEIFDEELLLQQLRQAKFWRDSQTVKNAATPVGTVEQENSAFPKKWCLTGDVSLHAWQKQCRQAWFSAGQRGIAKVVTGAGKTLLALAIAEACQHQHPDLHVAVIVPSVVLLTQWRDEFLQRSNLPASTIGLLGGGHTETFESGKRVLICVLHSASKKLREDIARTGIAKDLLLIVDECHRAGAAAMQRVFETPRLASLGLSATPERDDDHDDVEENTPSQAAQNVLATELGPVIYELNYATAIREGILPPFTVEHYGLSLQPPEAQRYDRLSREITDLRRVLETGTRRGLALLRWCRSKAAAKNPQAAQFVALTSQRKRLLYQMEQRRAAVLRLLREAFQENPQTKAILFHESIEEVMALFELLRHQGCPVVAEHSGFSDALRAESLRLFRQNTARVIVSARSLIEGFNVPSADLGIIVAASSSVRQRVQTLGRLLRKGPSTGGARKNARLCVLYADKTVDEMVYEKADWARMIGAERNLYFRWPEVDSTEPALRTAPPRRPPLSEQEIDPNSLRPGENYPGDTDEGTLYCVDTQGTVCDERGRFIEPHAELQEILTRQLKAGGRFRVTPLRRFVTRLKKNDSGWSGIYLGGLETPIQIAANGTENEPQDYAPGASYPLPQAKGTTYSVLQRDSRLIAKQSKSTPYFVVPLEKIADPVKRQKQAEVQQQLARAYSQGHRMSKIVVTAAGCVVYIWQNQAYYVGDAPEGAEGFSFEA